MLDTICGEKSKEEQKEKKREVQLVQFEEVVIVKRSNQLSEAKEILIRVIQTEVGDIA